MVQLEKQYHPGGFKRLSDAVEEFQLTMQHAVRQNLTADLQERAMAEENPILPPFQVHEMFDYLRDSDEEFYNWVFPMCAIRLTDETLSPMHLFILRKYRESIEPAKPASEDAQTE